MRLRIHLKNETEWRSADLRRLIRAAHVRVFDPGQRPVLYIHVKRARGSGGCRGRAVLGGCQVWLRLPREIADLRKLGALLVHELGHLRGLDHREMRGAPKWTWKGVPDGYSRWLKAHDWALAFTLRKAEPKARPTREQVAGERRLLAEQALVRWQRKAKLAATKIRKLRASVRYYDRRTAALREATP